MEPLDFPHRLDRLGKPGGVDETDALAAVEDDAVDLAGGGFAGGGGDADELVVVDLEQGGEHGGLAHVDPADDGERRYFLGHPSAHGGDCRQNRARCNLG